MTDEAKAVGIGLHVRDLCISKGVTRDNAETASLLAQQSAMEMAKWKDQQFKEYLEKLMKESTGEEAGYFVIRRIINELFKEDKK